MWKRFFNWFRRTFNRRRRKTRDKPPTEAPTLPPTEPPAKPPVDEPKAIYNCTWAFLSTRYYESVEGNYIDPITNWRDIYIEAFELGLKRIEAESGNLIKFIQVSDISQAQIRVGQHLMANEGVIAHAYFPYDRRLGLAQDVHFDSRDIGMSTAMFKDVTTHEVMHSLGNSHNSSEIDSIMYPRYMGIGQIFTDTDKANLKKAIEALVDLYENGKNTT